MGDASQLSHDFTGPVLQNPRGGHRPGQLLLVGHGVCRIQLTLCFKGIPQALLWRKGLSRVAVGSGNWLGSCVGTRLSGGGVGGGEQEVLEGCFRGKRARLD